MTKFLDVFLIAALCLNLYNTFANYTPNIEVMGMSVPTWFAVAIQLLCIGLISFKLYKNYAASKQI